MGFESPKAEDAKLAVVEQGRQPSALQVSFDSFLDTVPIPPGAWNPLSTIKHWTAISGQVEGIEAERSVRDQAAVNQADLVAAGSALVEAEAFRTASEKTLKHRAIALTRVKD